MVNAINSYGMYNPYYLYNYPRYNTNFNLNKTTPACPESNFQGSKIKLPKINKDIFSKSSKFQEYLPNREIKALCPNQRETIRNNSIEKERIHIAKPVTERTSYNTKQLRSAGVPEREIKKYLKLDGHVNDEGKKILKEHGKSYK